MYGTHIRQLEFIYNIILGSQRFHWGSALTRDIATGVNEILTVYVGLLSGDNYV